MKCEEEMCGRPVSATKPQAGLCDECLSLMEQDEIADRQFATFLHPEPLFSGRADLALSSGRQITIQSKGYKEKRP